MRLPRDCVVASRRQFNFAEKEVGLVAESRDNFPEGRRIISRATIVS